MNKNLLNSYFTIHPTSIGTIGAILAILLALALTENVLVLFALFILPLLQSQQVIPEMDEPEEEGEYDGGKFGFAQE
jgi:uncharacterized protein (UPF0254 family)